MGLGFERGIDESHSYKVKSFTRVLLLMLQSLSPECFCEMTYGQLIAYGPDQRDSTEALNGMRVTTVARMLNVNPLLVSCWACLFGGIRDPDEAQGKMKQLLAVHSGRALRVVEDDWQKQMAQPMKDSNLHMGPRALSDALLVSPASIRRRPAAWRGTIVTLPNHARISRRSPRSSEVFGPILSAGPMPS